MLKIDDEIRAALEEARSAREEQTTAAAMLLEPEVLLDMEQARELQEVQARAHGLYGRALMRLGNMVLGAWMEQGASPKRQPCKPVPPKEEEKKKAVTAPDALDTSDYGLTIPDGFYDFAMSRGRQLLKGKSSKPSLLPLLLDDRYCRHLGDTQIAELAGVARNTVKYWRRDRPQWDTVSSNGRLYRRGTIVHGVPRLPSDAPQKKPAPTQSNLPPLPPKDKKPKRVEEEAVAPPVVLIVGGDPRPKVCERFEALYGTQLEWPELGKTSNRVAAYVTKVHNGAFAAVLLLARFSSHGHQDAFKAACKEAGVPFRVVEHGYSPSMLARTLKACKPALVKADCETEVACQINAA